MHQSKRNPAATREKLVVAAVGLILENGYHATGVDAICERAGVTKGSFFHHFANKEEIGMAVIQWWSAMGTREYAAAWEGDVADPLEQLQAMLDIMAGFASRPDQPCVCAIGMMAQELASTHPEIRKSCAAELGVWTKQVADLLRKAQALHRPPHPFDAEKVAWFLNSLWQGSMLVAKTQEDPKMIASNLDLARTYLKTLFAGRTPATNQNKQTKPKQTKPKQRKSTK